MKLIVDAGEACIEFSVFQLTQNSTVLMSSRFGGNWDRIGGNRLRRLQTSQLWWIEEQVGRPPYGFKPSRVGPDLTVGSTISEMRLGLGRLTKVCSRIELSNRAA